MRVRAAVRRDGTLRARAADGHRVRRGFVAGIRRRAQERARYVRRPHLQQLCAHGHAASAGAGRSVLDQRHGTLGQMAGHSGQHLREQGYAVDRRQQPQQPQDLSLRKRSVA